MKENIELVRQPEASEKEPYNFAKIQHKLAEIKNQEMKEEPRKAQGQDLKPRDTIILQKFGYKSRSEIKDGQ